ncbi:MAG: hypothetical protein NVS3B24_14360 [Candidatus Dormibacteria bacterium]
MRDRWEALDARRQGMLAFPVLAVVTFLLNLLAFAQPLARAIIYGLIEGGAFTAMAILATRNEVARRRGDGS